MNNKTPIEDRIAQRVVARLMPYIQGNGHAVKQQARLMDTKEATRYLSVNEPALSHMKQRREEPFVKIASKVIYDRVELEKWISERSVA